MNRWTRILSVIATTFLVGVLAAHAAETRIPVVLSTDIGNEIDDQWAVTYLLLQPRLRVLGILSAHAPSLPTPAGRASYRILVDVVENRLGMRVYPPLIEGSSLPLEDARRPQPSAAVNFLIETSRPFSKANRLTVLAIGASTDVASSILMDPSIVDRIRVVQMGFINEQGGDEYNILNDVRAEQVILASDVPLVIGPASVCRNDLAMTYDHARTYLAERGAIGAWLWDEYQNWYFRNVKPLRVNDFSKPWYIWDDITLAYVLGMTEQHDQPRPHMKDDATFDSFDRTKTVTWITKVDQERLWKDFALVVDQYQRAGGHGATATARPSRPLRSGGDRP